MMEELINFRHGTTTKKEGKVRMMVMKMQRLAVRGKRRKGGLRENYTTEELVNFEHEGKKRSDSE